MSRAKLNPCPFCGAAADPAGALDWDDVGEEYVMCNNAFCVARGPRRSSKAAAVKAWNRRAERGRKP